MRKFVIIGSYRKQSSILITYNIDWYKVSVTLQISVELYYCSQDLKKNEHKGLSLLKLQSNCQLLDY